MGNRRVMRASLRVIAAALALLGALNTGAYAQIDTLLQPRGVPLSGLPLAGDPPTQAQDPITNGIQANTYVGIPAPTEPFDNTQPAGVVRTTEQTEYYVRLYTLGTTRPDGPWIMRASTVRGLTAEQLRDRFALPYTPDYITNVLVPAGTCLLSGIAGPILKPGPPPPNGPWGNGGAQQTFLVAHNNSDSCRYDFLVLGVNYINQRPLGANALWYAPVVGPGNAGNVGSYLDRLPAPAEYSDLYNAYNTLDVLNDGTATRLAPALTELTGENHASALWIALDNADRAARTLSDHARGALGGTLSETPQASAMMAYAAAPAAAIAEPRNPRFAPNGRWWVGGGGVFGRVNGNNERSGYHYGGGQGIIGYDWRVPDWLVGGAVAVESANLTVDGASNNNTLTSVRAGAYGATPFAGFTLDASALLSWDHYATSRDLPSFGRSASATYDGWNVAFAGDASRAFFAGNLRIEPLAGLSLIHLSRPGFTENGAGALSLVADRQNATKLMSRLGATLSAPVPVGDKLLRPWLRAFWGHDFLDDKGELNAAFVGATAPGTFNVLSAAPGRDTALVGVGARLEITPLAVLTIAYDGDWGRDGSTHSIIAGATVRW